MIMMKTLARMLLVGVMVLCGCAHVASTSATFNRLGGNSGNGLVLTVSRHVNTIIHGPDIEEDQLLVLEVSHARLGQRLSVPSDAVRARFSVERFGPSSRGEVFSGFIILKSVTDKQVVAHLHLDVTARTADGSYVQKAKFRGEHTFFREVGRD